MGCFDTLICQVPLPFPPELADNPTLCALLQSESFQTKDLDEGLGQYELRADGTLWQWVRPPAGNDADVETFGEARWLPATTVVSHVWFYTSLGEQHTGWLEMRATIVDGKLHRPIELVEYRPADPEEEAKRKAEQDGWMRGLGQ